MICGSCSRKLEERLFLKFDTRRRQAQLNCLPVAIPLLSVGFSSFPLVLTFNLSILSNGKSKNSCLFSHRVSFSFHSSAAWPGGGGGVVIFVIKYAVDASAIP